MSNDKPFFISQNTGFGKAVPADDLLHPEQNAAIKADSLTETQYFGFCIPEEHIHGFCYMWHHPNLNLVTGGPYVWQGHTYSMAHSLLCDFRAFMRDDVLTNDLHDYRLVNGYGVKIVEPLVKHHVTYEDAKRQHSIDLHYEAVSPPIMFGDGHHFEQPMKVDGEVMLRGKRYKVDCYSVRDRSWAKPRPEDNLPLPPMAWMQGVFNDDFAFNCNLFDQADRSPELVGTPFALPEGKTLNGGWLLRDGKVGCLVTGKKRAVRDPVSRKALYAEVELTDEFERTIHLRGTAIASVNFVPWQNLYAPIALMRWECEGLVTHGDFQEAIWNDYLNVQRL